MPQIAVQDYIVIAPKKGRSFQSDAAALGQLKKCVLNGTAFECLLRDINEDSDTLDRVLGVYDDGTATPVLVSDVSSDGVYSIPIPEYTLEQFAGLAAVQNALDESKGAVTEHLPFLEAVNSFLTEENSGCLICCDGKKLITTEDGILRSLEISSIDASTEEKIEIAWEDALKLIGLPID